MFTWCAIYTGKPLSKLLGHYHQPSSLNIVAFVVLLGFWKRSWTYTYISVKKFTETAYLHNRFHVKKEHPHIKFSWQIGSNHHILFYIITHAHTHPFPEFEELFAAYLGSSEVCTLNVSAVNHNWYRTRPLLHACFWH